MPWTPEEFKSKHNHGLSKQESKQAAAVANNVLERTGDDAQAIRTANGVVKKRRHGGPVHHDHRYGR
jgi:hypothetical protein